MKILKLNGERKTLSQSEINEFFNSIKLKFTKTTFEFDTVKINVQPENWVEAHEILKK